MVCVGVVFKAVVNSLLDGARRWARYSLIILGSLLAGLAGCTSISYVLFDDAPYLFGGVLQGVRVI